MNSTDRKLLLLYVLTLLTAGLVCLFFEVLWPEGTGCLFHEEDRTLRTVFETLSILASLAGVYGALRIISLKSVSARLSDEQGYCFWGIVRWGMITVPLLLSELTYYLFLSTNVVAFVAICGIAMLFVWPSADRRIKEMAVSNEEMCGSNEEMAGSNGENHTV